MFGAQEMKTKSRSILSHEADPAVFEKATEMYAMSKSVNKDKVDENATKSDIAIGDRVLLKNEDWKA